MSGRTWMTSTWMGEAKLPAGVLLLSCAAAMAGGLLSTSAMLTAGNGGMVLKGAPLGAAATSPMEAMNPALVGPCPASKPCWRGGRVQPSLEVLRWRTREGGSSGDGGGDSPLRGSQMEDTGGAVLHRDNDVCVPVNPRTRTGR